MNPWTIQHADALTALRSLPSASVDSVVTDPPAGIGFMGKDWDKDRQGRKEWIAWLAEIMAEAHRVLKPGGHALVWALPRTSHWTATALEDAGFEVRDSIHHLYGSGFPKSMDVSKAIDKQAGAERPVVGTWTPTGTAKPVVGGKGHKAAQTTAALGGYARQDDVVLPLTAPATPDAKAWSGWGTALKPSHEVWWLCRKPPAAKTVAAQVLDTGTGALNIDATRIESDGSHKRNYQPTNNPRAVYGKQTGFIPKNAEGRWPSNLLLSHSPACDLFTCTDDCPVAELDRQSGVTPSNFRRDKGRYLGVFGNGQQTTGHGQNDTGGASRFFPTFRYQAKPSRRERGAGLDQTAVFTYPLTDQEKTLCAATVISLQKATSGIPTVSWHTGEYGASITARCPKDCLSTTLTAISEIMLSKTLPWLTHSLTNGYMEAVSCETACGGSLAESVESLSPLTPNTTNAGTALGPNVEHVQASVLKQIIDAANWHPATNSHATVKSVALMRWLCRLITPPGGLVADMFMGSGTTGVACAAESFRFWGCDENAEYIQIATARVSAAYDNSEEAAS